MGFRDTIDHAIAYRHAYTLAFSASMGSIFYGWDIGIIGGVTALSSFKAYFGIDKMTSSAASNLNGNIVAILQAGALYVSFQWPSLHTQRSRHYLALVPSLQATCQPDSDESLSSWLLVFSTSSGA